MAQKNHGRPKHQDVENPTPLCVDSISPRAEGATGQPRGSRAGSSNCKKSVWANQQMDSLAPTKRPARNATQEDATRLLVKERTEERLLNITPLRPRHLSSQHSVPEDRRTQKHSHKPTNKVPPVNNVTFSPPNQSPRTSPQGGCHVCRGKKAPNGEDPEQNVMFDRKSAARRTGVDAAANSDLSVCSPAPTSKYHKPPLFSTLSVPLLRKNQLQHVYLPRLTQRTPRAVQWARAAHSP